MTTEIFVSTTPFGEADQQSLQLLKHSGHRIRQNDKGRKLTSIEVASEAQNATVLIAGTEDLGPLIETSSSLRMISRVGIGLDGVPLEVCQQRGIAVSWTPDAVTLAVAEFTVGLMLTSTRFIVQANLDLRNEVWRRPSGHRLGKSVIGIVGFGRVGSNVASLLTSFLPAEVLVYDVADKSEEIELLRKRGLNIRTGSFDELLTSSNILSVHTPLYSATRGMFGADELAMMPDGAILINTARGEIVSEEALYLSLANGHLGGAALDVFEHEPYTGPLVELDNVILTPHIASCSIDCRRRMEIEAVEEALRFLNHQPLLQQVPIAEYG
jgi:D-3-phosphoglycerate dehydrogenase